MSRCDSEGNTINPMGLTMTTVMEVCHALTPVFMTTGLTITRAGEIPDALYIVRCGVVAVLVGADKVMDATRGHGLE